MEKVKELLSELRGLNTNDPAMQRRVVAVLEELIAITEQQTKRLDAIEEQNNV